MDGIEFKKSLKTTFLTGLFITFPAVLSVIALRWLFQLLDGILGPIIYRLIGRDLPGLGLAFSLFGIYIVGVLATTVFGRQIIARVDKAMLRLPIFKSLYSTFKQLGDAFSPNNRAAFKKFVIVEYPRLGMYSFGFLTKECIIKNDLGVDECYNTVYVPTNNLYLGEVTLFRKDDVIVTDLSIEEGIKVMLSAGIAAPSMISKSRNYASHVHDGPGQHAALAGKQGVEG